LHRQGSLAEAEGGYRKIPKEDPAHWQALHQRRELANFK
jgi:hypothetical protein